MGFQDTKGKINWKVHFSSPIKKVYQALSTDAGRRQFWAENAFEKDGYIEFEILNYPKYLARIIAMEEDRFFHIEYFGTDVRFHLESTTDDNGTDLTLIATVPNDEVKYEMTAGWVSVLMAMKAAVDFGVDLRNHNIKRVWENGYLDN